MLWKSAQHRHWALVALTTLAGVVLSGGGFLYEASRSRALHEWVRERLPPTSRASAQLLEGLRMRAALAAAQDQLDGEKLGLSSVIPEVELRFLERAGDVYKSVASPMLNANPDDDILGLPHDAVAASVDQTALLWPTVDPKSIAFCSQSRANRIACASLPLDNFLTLAGGSSALGVRYALVFDDRIIARTPNWGDGDAAYEKRLPVALGGIQLLLTGRAGQRLKESYGMADGHYFGIGSLAVSLVALVVIFARRRGVFRQLALENAIKRSRVVGDDLVRATLRNVAKSAGVLVWLVHEDERMELIGPWMELAGIPEGETTLALSVASLKDGESVYAGIADAMRARKAWSRVLVQEQDGESITYQAHCAPLFDADGRFVGMLGVSSDISEALKTHSRVLRDEAYRNAQTGYLRHMAKEVSGPAMHVQAVVDMLTRQFGVTDNPELKRLMDLAATEARRLSDVVRGSLELMSLRSKDVKDELRPMRIDNLVKEVADGVAAREGTARQQTVVVVNGATDGSVLAHKSSLVTMLNIVLTNAMRYSPPGGHVEVRLLAEESALHIEVEDSGPGMKPEELARLGEPFFRGSASIGVQGSGLGIATCFELAIHTNSSIRIIRSGNPERGLLVTISLPWSK